jgi:cullin-associated NEDD8-dissociated protein 1
LEQISKHCPREISNDYINLFKHALELLQYDPNFVYENDDAAMDDEDGGDDGWGSFDGDDDQQEMGAGEDTSWKVRRSAVALVSAIIRSRPEIQRNIVESGDVNVLIGRFKERTNDVKCELLACFGTILTTSVEFGQESIEKELAHKMSVQKKKSYTDQIAEEAGPIVKELLKLLDSKDLKVRIQALKTLTDVAVVIQSALDDYSE